MPTDQGSSCSTVLICQHKACCKAGAARVLAAFKNADLPQVEIKTVQCLGQCGNGPMVLILPEETWYAQIHPEEVEAIVTRHLHQGKPVKSLLYRKFHPEKE